MNRDDRAFARNAAGVLAAFGACRDRRIYAPNVYELRYALGYRRDTRSIQATLRGLVGRGLVESGHRFASEIAGRRGGHTEWTRKTVNRPCRYYLTSAGRAALDMLTLERVG